MLLSMWDNREILPQREHIGNTLVVREEADCNAQLGKYHDGLLSTFDDDIHHHDFHPITSKRASM